MARKSSRTRWNPYEADPNSPEFLKWVIPQYLTAILHLSESTANHSKDALLIASAVTHSLDNQLSTLATSCRNIQRDIYSAEELPDQLDIILKSAQAIENTIASLRGFRDALSHCSDKEEFDISALATEVVDGINASGKYDHPVRYNPEKGVMTYGSPNLARFVLLNLLGNAWKYTSKADNPLVSFGRRNGELYVRDNGTGLPPAREEDIFQPGVRLRYHAEHWDGDGLGLGLVSIALNRTGGNIRAESKGYMQGSTFLFNFG